VTHLHALRSAGMRSSDLLPINFLFFCCLVCCARNLRAKAPEGQVAQQFDRRRHCVDFFSYLCISLMDSDTRNEEEPLLLINAIRPGCLHPHSQIFTIKHDITKLHLNLIAVCVVASSIIKLNEERLDLTVPDPC
jgi:hypothetical protein